MSDTRAISIPPSESSFRIGEVFNKSFSVFARHAVPFIVLTAIAYIPIYIFAYLQAGRTGDIGAGTIIIGILAFIGFLVCPVIASGAVVYGVVQDLRGSSFSTGDAVHVAIGRLLAMIGVALCVGLLTALGAVLLLVPGLIVMCMYYVAAPTTIVEREGVFNSMSRSAALTKGHRWQIFGIILLVVIVNLVIGAVLVGIGLALGSVASAIMEQVWQVVVGAFNAVVSGVLYYQLRVAKEGVDINQIASVFD
jgi:hypothetical protein